jgi:hypothetical protein
LIRKSIETFPEIVTRYLANNLVPYEQENIKGRVYRKVDFDDLALAQALSYIGDGLNPQELKRIQEATQCLYLR